MIGIHIISWQLTRRCNLKCEYCYTDSSPLVNTATELSTEECFTIIKELKNTPGIAKDPMLILTGGEPLLRKDIFDIVKKAASEDFYVVLGTNGGPLTDDKITRLKPHVKGISVNIDYVKALRGFPELNRAVASKMAAVKRLNKHKIPFIINTTIHKENIPQLEDIAQFAFDNGAHSLNFFSLVPTGRGNNLYHTAKSDYDEAIEKILNIKESYKEKLSIITKCAPHINAYIFSKNPENIRMFEGSGGCPAAKSYMCITPEGDVLPCPYFPLGAAAGNVRDTKIEYILNTEIFHQLRERHLKGVCGECEFAYLCSGCRARAYAINGDYLSEDPLCNYTPKGDVKIEEKTIIEKGGTVYGIEEKANKELIWTTEAEERIKRIPPFVRPMVKMRIESRAKDMNVEVITPEVLAKIRGEVSSIHTAGKFGIKHPNFIKKTRDK